MTTYVYFISAGANPIKIGLSDNPEARLLDLQTAHYRRLYLLFKIACTSRENAFAIESAFHRWYADCQLINEWFDVIPSQIHDDVHLLMQLAKSAIEFHICTDSGKVERLEERVRVRRASNQGVEGIAIRDPGGRVTGWICPGCKKELSISEWSRHKKSCPELAKVEVVS